MNSPPPGNIPPKLASARSIQEFWIDFLLEEEFTVDSGFLPAFLNKCEFEFPNAKVLEVAHSVSARDQYGVGESDLIVIFNYKGEGEASRGALLIEDKINAAFQPHQAERYRHRGERGVSAGSWDAFRTILVAPTRYISGPHGFDAAVSLEAITEWICPGDSARRDFRKARLEAAIAKKNATGVQIVDDAMTAFRKSFFDFLRKWNESNGTDFAMPPPKPAFYDDNWFVMTRSGLPAASQFRYMSRSGIVELGFNNTPLEKLEPLIHSLPRGVELKSTGRRKQHSAFRMSVEPISDFSSFEEQRSKVQSAMAVLLQISRFHDQAQDWLEPAISEARTE